MLMAVTITGAIVLVFLEYRILYWRYYQQHWGKPWQAIKNFARYAGRKR